MKIIALFQLPKWLIKRQKKSTFTLNLDFQDINIWCWPIIWRGGSEWKITFPLSLKEAGAQKATATTWHQNFSMFNQPSIFLTIFLMIFISNWNLQNILKFADYLEICKISWCLTNILKFAKKKYLEICERMWGRISLMGKTLKAGHSWPQRLVPAPYP